jgi:hypothetical protein
VSDREDLAMQSLQPSLSASHLDRIRAEPEPTQLLQSDDAVLPRREIRQRLLQPEPPSFWACLS